MPHLLKNGDSKWLTAALPCMVYCGSTKRLAEGCCLLPHQRFTVTPLEAVHHCAILRHTCTIKRKVKTSSRTAACLLLPGACLTCKLGFGVLRAVLGIAASAAVSSLGALGVRRPATDAGLAAPVKQCKQASATTGIRWHESSYSVSVQAGLSLSTLYYCMTLLLCTFAEAVMPCNEHNKEGGLT